MDDCSNPPSHFFSSYCTGVDEPILSTNPLSVHVECNDLTATRDWTDPTPEYSYETFCRDDEICVTQEDVPNHWLEGTDEADMEGDTLVDVAWCVSKQNFVKIAKDPMDHMTKPDAVAAPYAPVADGSKVSVEAILVGPRGRPVFADKMVVEAQATGLVNGEKVWHTLIGGANASSHCSRLSLTDVPLHTHRILIHTILPFAVPTALLYLSRHVTT